MVFVYNIFERLMRELHHLVTDDFRFDHLIHRRSKGMRSFGVFASIAPLTDLCDY